VAKCLLSFKTATSLSLISCSDNVVCSVLPETPKEVTNSFPKVFQGLGKLRGYTAKFRIDENTQPVAQPVGSQNEVPAKLDSLVENDADPLSRMVTRLDYAHLIAVAKESLSIALSWEVVIAKSKQCKEIQQLVKAIHDNDFSICSIDYKAVSSELNEVQNVVLRNNRIVVPVCLRNHVIQLAHEGHQCIVKT